MRRMRHGCFAIQPCEVLADYDANASVGAASTDRVKPHYNDAGEACCPVHGKRLNEREWEGRTFWSCPAKADTAKGEKANAKGYCSLKFDL